MSIVKTLVSLLGGLIAGFALSSWWTRDAPQTTRGRPSTAYEDSADRFAELERALLAESDRRAVLERRVEALREELSDLRASESGEDASEPRSPERDEIGAGRLPDAAAETDAAARAARRFGARGFADADPQQQIDSLVAGGFAPERAEWLTRRAAELRMQALQVQYDTRRGVEVDPARRISADQALRNEIGDSEYEQYLAALGAPTTVFVRNVLTSSPAETAGFQPGDEIVSYAGTRIFDMGELNRLTLEGDAGEPVIVEVLRDGQRVQLVLPRGPVGIMSGGFRGRP